MSRKSKLSQQEQQNDSSNLSIQQLADKAVENQINDLRTELLRAEDKFLKMSEVCDNLIKQLEYKEEEISHLKSLLSGMTPVIGEVQVLPISDEELIADIQLRKLRDNAKIRELTLDETRKFDLLVKNKRLAQGQATNIDKNEDKLPKSLGSKQLLQIASKKTED